MAHESVFLSGALVEKRIAAHKQGASKGLFSVCSAHPFVLACAIQFGIKKQVPIVIESTCNQVNQYGGYTGLTPAQFSSRLLEQIQNASSRSPGVLLGGDHLGPFPWRSKPADAALTEAARLVAEAVGAGYRKIHLDASMALGSEDLSGDSRDAIIAERTAQLCQTAESAVEDSSQKPVYVIGTEVPAPGGEVGGSVEVHVTEIADVDESLALVKGAFQAAELDSAWERVVAVVVQPGVEFFNDRILDYEPGRAQKLSRYIEEIPNFVFEAHSTDYQTQASLKNLVRDHFMILKVGPALTFAYREGIFALEAIEKALAKFHSGWQPSEIAQVIDVKMREHPADWQSHYSGSPSEQAFLRKYSFRDRIRYYWASARVEGALQRLFANLESCEVPLPLISQHFPAQYEKIRGGELDLTPQSWVADRVFAVLERYQDAVG
jgi:D-tagatose-1,6-bisphosphate aldolase subunit GatZ/KbaZ